MGVSLLQGTTRGILVNVLGSATAVVAMSSQPDLWLAVEPAHLPHYSHTAVVVGSVIILSIIVLIVGITFVWSKRRSPKSIARVRKCYPRLSSRGR